jgi:16S rRNA G966 N2-methylase RsmD
MKEHELVKVKLSDLQFDKTNPNTLTQDQMAGLRESMKKFGYLTPIIIDQKNMIADGEHRALVYKEFGLKEIPAYKLNLKNDVERRILRQVMNKLHGTHDHKLDADELAKIFQGDRLEELSKMIAASQDNLKQMILSHHPEIAFENPEEFTELTEKQLDQMVPNTQLGDMYDLGRNRLICADCTDKRSLDRLLDDGKLKPDMIFTDPPFDLEYGDLSNAFDAVKNLADLQFWMMGDKQAVYLTAKHFDKFTKFYIYDWIQPIILNSNLPMPQHNLIAQFGSRPARNLFDGFSSIVRVQTLRSSNEHKIFKMGKKPELPQAFITHYAKEGGLILDIFGGSGSTLIAAEKCGFPCAMVEIDPRYCDLIVNRWQKYTGLKAVVKQS